MWVAAAGRQVERSFGLKRYATISTNHMKSSCILLRDSGNVSRKIQEVTTSDILQVIGQVQLHKTPVLVRITRAHGARTHASESEPSSSSSCRPFGFPSSANSSAS